MKWVLILFIFLGCSQTQRKIASEGNSISIITTQESDYQIFLEDFKSNPEKLYEKILNNEVDPRFYDLIAKEYFRLYKLNDKGFLSQSKNGESFYHNQVLLLIKDELSDERNLKLAATVIPQLPPAKQIVDETRISLGLLYNERNFRLMQEALRKDYFLINTEAMNFAEGFFKKNYRLRPKQSIEMLMTAEKYFVPVYRKKFLEILLAHMNLITDDFFINTVAKRVYDYYPRTQFRSIYQRHIVLRMDPEESRMENDLVHRLAKRTSDLKTRDALIALLDEIPPPSFQVQHAVKVLSEKHDQALWSVMLKAVERNYFFENENPKEMIEAFLNREDIPKDAKFKLLLVSSKFFENDKNLFIERIRSNISKETTSNISSLKKFLKDHEAFLETDFLDLLPKAPIAESKEKACSGIFDKFISFFRGRK